VNPITESFKNELLSPYALTAEQIAFFQLNGFIKLKNVFSPPFMQYMNETISTEVSRLNTQKLDLNKRDTYGKAFLQIMNIWTCSDRVREIVFSKRLAKIASELLQTSGVRLYHDQALFKEPAGGHTPWHADQYYWPLGTDRTVTVWIPLQKTPLAMGPLEFSARSHSLNTGRDMEIGDESQARLQKALGDAGFDHVVEAFDLGECSFHRGWLFHRAGQNTTGTMRGVMTVIYMDKDITLKQPENKNQVNDWNTWCPGARIGEVINTPLNPVLYEK